MLEAVVCSSMSGTALSFWLNFENRWDRKLKDRTDDPLAYGDSRSQKLKDIAWTGTIVNDLADEFDIRLAENPREREDQLRHLFSLIDAELDELESESQLEAD